MVDLFAAEKLPQSGLVRQEHSRLPDFPGNQFGCIFQPEFPKNGRLKRAGTAGDAGMQEA
jgi:hypothetical protein